MVPIDRSSKPGQPTYTSMMNSRDIDDLRLSNSAARARSYESLRTFSLTASKPQTSALEASSLPTPPSSTRPSIEQAHSTSVLPRQNLNVPVDAFHQPQRVVYFPATPPNSPPKCTEPPTLLSVIASVRDVLEGRQSQRTIKNVSSNLYEELNARAKMDRDLVGWENTRCVSFSILEFLVPDFIMFIESISTTTFLLLAVPLAQVTRSLAICFIGLTEPILTR
jgi:hypothetical protein